MSPSRCRSAAVHSVTRWTLCGLPMTSLLRDQVSGVIPSEHRPHSSVTSVPVPVWPCGVQRNVLLGWWSRQKLLPGAGPPQNSQSRCEATLWTWEQDIRGVLVDTRPTVWGQQLVAAPCSQFFSDFIILFFSFFLLILVVFCIFSAPFSFSGFSAPVLLFLLLFLFAFLVYSWTFSSRCASCLFSFLFFILISLFFSSFTFILVFYSFVLFFFYWYAFISSFLFFSLFLYFLFLLFFLFFLTSSSSSSSFFFFSVLLLSYLFLSFDIFSSFSPSSTGLNFQKLKVRWEPVASWFLHMMCVWVFTQILNKPRYHRYAPQCWFHNHLKYSTLGHIFLVWWNDDFTFKEANFESALCLFPSQHVSIWSSHVAFQATL